MAKRITRKTCRHLKIRGENWRIVIARPPRNDCRALCHYDTKTIFIRPSADNKIECVVHEVLHACFYDLEEEAISEAEQAIVNGLLVLPKIAKIKGLANEG